MVCSPKSLATEGIPLIGGERIAPWVLWRPSSSTGWSPGGSVEDRIRRVFHLDRGDPLPLVGQDALGDYHAHLARFMSFPFRASLCEEMEPLVLDSSVIVVGLRDPLRTPLNSAMGIVCEVIFRNVATLPLALLKVGPWNPNCRTIDDYWHWFWNCR